MIVRPIAADELERVIVLWHETSADTYGFIPVERDRVLADRRGYFTTNIAPQHDLWVAHEGTEIVGFLAIRDSLIDRLYVHPTAQRRGVGAALLAKARELQPEHLTLYTHQKNTKARAFYEKHGFRATRFGVSPPPESEPDVFYEWRAIRAL